VYVWEVVDVLPPAWQVVGVAYICQLVICSVLLLIYWNIESMAWRDVAATQVVIALVVKLTFSFELNKLCKRVEYDLEDPVAVGYPVNEGYSVTMEDPVVDEALVTEENPVVKEDSEMPPKNEEP
jgi:hypothetical protein